MLIRQSARMFRCQLLPISLWFVHSGTGKPNITARTMWFKSQRLSREIPPRCTCPPLRVYISKLKREGYIGRPQDYRWRASRPCDIFLQQRKPEAFYSATADKIEKVLRQTAPRIIFEPEFMTAQFSDGRTVELTRSEAR